MIRRASVLAVLFALAALLACTRRSGDGPARGVDAGSFDKRALLRAFGQCAVSTYEEFVGAAEGLEVATATDRGAAQEAFRRAMDVWQRAELFQFGPAATSASVGGQDMRDGIYSWPLVGLCLIDSQLVSEAYLKPEFDGALVSTKGLAAIEYLLFNESTTNACAETSSINAQGTWAALGPTEIARRRNAYAHAAAIDVAARARTLSATWTGDFLATFEAAGSGGPFTSQQMAFNAVSDAMFYLDLRVKNEKVGIPAGLLPECGAAACPDRVESRWAKRSKENLRNNVVGYEALLRGCSASRDLGLEELLRAVGADSVAAKLDASVVDVRGALDALTEPSFEEDIVNNPAGVLRLFDALRANATIMKAEMATVLDLELPKEALADND